ncbi:hypothetical protein HPULCUR_009171 [Helicostylum pulchrum]|uniref:Uncharacterized protein n=1 Tax=Helicostylum pulchrum TaxID=562976 RepID=A0ABP9Y9X5_9FUNG
MTETYSGQTELRHYLESNNKTSFKKFLQHFKYDFVTLYDEETNHREFLDLWSDRYITMYHQVKGGDLLTADVS